MLVVVLLLVLVVGGEVVGNAALVEVDITPPALDAAPLTIPLGPRLTYALQSGCGASGHVSS